MRNRKGGMSRRQFLGAAAGTAAVAALDRGTQRRKPNVIFVFSDEHRWQSMSFTELAAVQTPNMARLAEEGASFSHCVSNYPVCSPYRAILMSGLWPQQQGVIDNNIPLSADGPSLGKTFKAAGYATGYIGKWHLGGTRAEPFGFDESLIWTNLGSHWDKGTYHPRDGEPVAPKGYGATVMTDQALDFVTRHSQDAFFLMLSLNPPHADFLAAPEEMKALYPAQGSLPWRPNVPEASRQGQDAKNNVLNQNSWPYYQGYHAHVSAVDRELGRIMAKLDELGLAQDTILLYTSDHGSMLGSHGVGSKRQPYEESIRVPFIARWPGIILAGARPAALLGTIDLFPTLCGLTGTPIPAHCQGLDFSPVLRGEQGPDPESQFIMHLQKDNASGGVNHPAPLFRGVRTKRHTYASLVAGGGLLFDNEADPYQMENLHGKPEFEAIRRALEEETRVWLRRAGDSYEIVQTPL